MKPSPMPSERPVRSSSSKYGSKDGRSGKGVSNPPSYNGKSKNGKVVLNRGSKGVKSSSSSVGGILTTYASYASGLSRESIIAICVVSVVASLASLYLIYHRKWLFSFFIVAEINIDEKVNALGLDSVPSFYNQRDGIVNEFDLVQT